MEPSTNVDGDRKRTQRRRVSGTRFNGAVDERRRRRERFYVERVKIERRFNGAVDERRRRLDDSRMVPPSRIASMEPSTNVDGDSPTIRS